MRKSLENEQARAAAGLAEDQCASIREAPHSVGQDSPEFLFSNGGQPFPNAWLDHGQFQLCLTRQTSMRFRASCSQSAQRRARWKSAAASYFTPFASTF